MRGTVGGRNPAPAVLVSIPLFTEFHTSQVVQDFFHQQYLQKFPSHLNVIKISSLAVHQKNLYGKDDLRWMHFSNRDDRQVAEVEVESLKGKKINLFICLGLASADFGINTFKDYITCICVSVIFDGGVVHS